jgi:hypothetical protein
MESSLAPRYRTACPPVEDHFAGLRAVEMAGIALRATGARAHVDQARTWSFYFEGERFFATAHRRQRPGRR